MKLKALSIEQKTILPLLSVNFIGALGYSIILPFLVFLVIDFGGQAILYGFIAAIYPAFQMVGAPILGRWSDKIGRKKVLLISQAGTLLSWCIFLVAFAAPANTLFSITTSDYGLIVLTVPLLILFIARALDGLTGGNISVANAYLSDLSSEKTRKANFGKMSASMNLGFILGPVIAGFLASQPQGKMLTVVAATAVSVVGLVVIIFYLPDIRSKRKVDGCPEEKLKKTLTIETKDCIDRESGKSSIFKLPLAPALVSLYFFIFLGYNIFYATFPIYASENLQWDPVQLGYFFTILSSVMIIVQGPVLTRISEKHSEEKLFMIGSFIMVLTFTLFSQTNMWLIYLAAVFYGLGNGIMWPSYLAMLSKVGNSDQQGSLQGVASSFGSFASIIGLLIGGFILNLFVEKVYLLSAFILFMIAVAGIFLLLRNKKTETSLTTENI